LIGWSASWQNRRITQGGFARHDELFTRREVILGDIEEPCFGRQKHN
jgi:hypothetical protein